MEEGRQKSKRLLSYTAKFKREVIRCAENKGNRKAAANFGVNESNTRQRSAGVRRHERNSLDPRKDGTYAGSIIFSKSSSRSRI
jgi:hypothetical protein